MSSYQGHIGPWPIKRHHSVPDGSVKLFTPRNSPPSLARFLDAKYQGEKFDHQDSTSGLVGAPGFDEWRGFSPFRIPNSNQAQTSEVEVEIDAADEPQYIVVRGKVNQQRQVNLLQPIVLLGSSAFVVVPAVIISLFAVEQSKECRVSERLSLHRPLPQLASAVSMMAGLIASIALSALDSIKQGKGLGNRGIRRELMAALAFGLFLTTCMLAFARVLLSGRC